MKFHQALVYVSKEPFFLSIHGIHMKNHGQVNKHGGSYLSDSTERTVCLEGSCGCAFDGVAEGKDDGEDKGEVEEGGGEVESEGLVAPHLDDKAGSS